MSIILAVAFTVMIFSLFVQFARHEFIEEYYEDIIIDVEGRLEWAHSLRSFPFGMASQLDACREHLDKAQDLYKRMYVIPSRKKAEPADKK